LVARNPEGPEEGRKPQGQLTVGCLGPYERCTEVVELCLDPIECGVLSKLEVGLELFGES
jgi:hypothetical protein